MTHCPTTSLAKKCSSGSGENSVYTFNDKNPGLQFQNHEFTAEKLLGMFHLECDVLRDKQFPDRRQFWLVKVKE